MAADRVTGVRVPPSEARLVPFAIGVIVVAVADEELPGEGRSGDRLAVALAAWRAGYFLLDTIEVGTGEPVTGPGWARVWELAAAADPDRLFVHGMDAVKLEPKASELRLLVRRVDTDAPSGVML